MTLNFFGRFTSILTISLEVVNKFIIKFFSIIIYLIEMFRRGIWNFLELN